MLADVFGMDSIIVLIVAVVVLFGSSQLPKLAKNIGSAGREFHRAHREATGEVDAAAPAKARHELGWQPRYPTWREGFTAAYGEQPDTASRS
jgi:TatA/E family protein of Tat protein translocase